MLDTRVVLSGQQLASSRATGDIREKSRAAAGSTEQRHAKGDREVADRQAARN